MNKIKRVFDNTSRWVCLFVGSPTAFGMAVALIVGWCIYAAPHHFDDSSQMWINSVTTIITFLIVFLIQNSQNRDSRAIHLKLDELIRIHAKARNSFVKAEEMDDEEAKQIAEEFKKICGRNP